VIADLAEIVTDVRFLTASQAARVDSEMRRLHPHAPRCTLELSGGVERGSFERSKATVRLYRMAAQAAAKLGFQLAEAAVGGGRMEILQPLSAFQPWTGWARWETERTPLMSL
jgi:glutamate carboxypeptidase